MHLRNFDKESFLRDSWQKKPYLFRNAWNSWKNPIDPDELAGLACESIVESRLINQGQQRAELEHGPLTEERFNRLGKTPWTLLVQAVDHHVPAVAALIEPFRFVPDWRIDDVMVSYAVEGGGVGPHFDQYDVFLVQGLGRRRWQIGGECDADAELLPHDDLQLLANFEATCEWVLEPGDMLYVPPRFAHNGIAVSDDCMTYSIGFRAPSRQELMENWVDSLLVELEENDRYADPDPLPQQNPGEITPAAIERLHAMVTEKLLDPRAFGRWFARYNTVPKNPDIDWRPEVVIGAGTVRSLLAEGTALLRNPASRYSFIRSPASLSLFVNGECFECSGALAAFAERLCAQARIETGPDIAASEQIVCLLAELLNQGALAFKGED